jgi:hypothetical protein
MLCFTAWVVLLPGAFALLNFAATLLDPFLKMWTAQSIFYSPPPWQYLLAYVLILPFVIAGGIRLWARADPMSLLPVVWVAALPVLAYAPVAIQRRLPEGIWVAMVALAIVGLERLRPVLRKASIALLAPAFFSSIFLLVGGTLVAMRPAEPAFVPAAEIPAFQYLADHAKPKAVVLASFRTGNALPAWAPEYVLAGHGPESVDLAAVLPRVDAFYNLDTPPEMRAKFLKEWKVAFIFWGPQERALGGWDPRRESYALPVFHNGEYWIFRVADR